MTVLPDFRQTEFGLQVRLPQTLFFRFTDRFKLKKTAFLTFTPAAEEHLERKFERSLQGRHQSCGYSLLIRLIMEAPTQSTATISAKTNSPVIEKLYRGTT
jgi:hypothetical protein